MFTKVLLFAFLVSIGFTIGFTALHRYFVQPEYKGVTKLIGIVSGGVTFIYGLATLAAYFVFGNG